MADSSGLSPIDVAGTVAMFMTKEQLPLDRLKQAEKKQEVQLSAFGNLQNLIQDFQTSLQQLNTAFTTVNYQVNSTNTNVVTAQISGNNNAPLSHSVTVNQLAQAESQGSTVFTSSSAVLNITDTLGFSVGSSNFSINVTPTDSLQNIRDNINNAFSNVGVTASVFSTTAEDGSAQYQLVVSSNQTGVANKVSLTDSAHSFGFTESSAAADAIITFDNQKVQRSSNTMTDVLDGLSLSVASLGSSTVSITGADPSTQTNSASTAITNMITSYNKVLGFIDANQANPQTHNETFAGLKMNLQTAMMASFQGTGAFTTLSDIGIVTISDDTTKKETTTMITDKDGKQVQKTIKYSLTGQLQLNTDSLLPQLSNVLSTQFSGVQSFLTNAQTGILTAVNSLVDPLTGSIPSSIKSSSSLLSASEQKYQQDIADEDMRLKGIETDYYKKFSDLNVLLQKLQNTNDYLTKQLRNLEPSNDK